MCRKRHSWFLQSSCRDQASQIWLRGIEGWEGELDGGLFSGLLVGFAEEFARRAVGKKKGCLKVSKESPRKRGPF